MGSEKNSNQGFTLTPIALRHAFAVAAVIRDNQVTLVRAHEQVTLLLQGFEFMSAIRLEPTSCGGTQAGCDNPKDCA